MLIGAHPDWHQHGVSIQISVNLGKKFLRISPIRSIAVTWILARVFAYLPSFFSQILDLIYLTVLIFIFIYSGMAWHRKPAIATAAQDWLKSKTSDHQKCWNKILLKSYHLVRDYPKINTHTIAHFIIQWKLNSSAKEGNSHIFTFRRMILWPSDPHSYSFLVLFYWLAHFSTDGFCLKKGF